MEDEAGLCDEQQKVNDVVVIVLIEGLQQNLELAQDLVGGHRKRALVVQLQDPQQLVLHVVAHLAVVVHAEAEQRREAALHDSRLPQLLVRFLHDEDLREAGGERAHRGGLHVSLLRFVHVQQNVQAVVALQALHVVRHFGKDELQQIEQLHDYTDHSTRTLRQCSLLPASVDMMHEKNSTGEGW